MTGDYLKAVAATLNAMRPPIAAGEARGGRPAGYERTDMSVTSAADSSRRSSTSRCARSITAALAGTFKRRHHRPGPRGLRPSARLVWNAMIDRRPGLILRCTSTADVVAAVNVAREHGLPPAVRCGGHTWRARRISEGGLTIDLGGLREVTVDAERKLVHAGGGCRLGDVDAATAPHGLIVAGRHHVRDRRGRAGPGRRHRLVLPQARPDLRPVRRAGGGAGQRRGGRGHPRERAPGAVLGARGRRRQLRHRHPVHVPRPGLRPDDAHRRLAVRRGARGRGAARLRRAGTRRCRARWASTRRSSTTCPRCRSCRRNWSASGC